MARVTVSGSGYDSWMNGSNRTDVVPSGPCTDNCVGVCVKVTLAGIFIGALPIWLDADAVELKQRAVWQSRARGNMLVDEEEVEGKLRRLSRSYE